MHSITSPCAFLQELGIGLRSVTEVINGSSQGRFTENILAAVAQVDNDVRSERTVVGMREALSRGRWTSISLNEYIAGAGRQDRVWCRS